MDSVDPVDPDPLYLATRYHQITAVAGDPLQAGFDLMIFKLLCNLKNAMDYFLPRFLGRLCDQS